MVGTDLNLHAFVSTFTETYASMSQCEIFNLVHRNTFDISELKTMWIPRYVHLLLSCWFNLRTIYAVLFGVTRNGELANKRSPHMIELSVFRSYNIFVVELIFSS